MKDPDWFFKKWGVKRNGEVPIDDIYKKLSNLEILVKHLELRIEELERENVETTNSIYEIANSLEARIDILASEPYNLDKFAVD
jgi:hypothetical protein